MSPLRILTIFLSFSSIIVQGQSLLRGVVLDAETLKPLPGVVVYIHDIKKGSVTNEEGMFEIDELPKGKFIVELKLIGYTSHVERIQVDGVSEISVSLKSVVTELNEVVITGISHSTELKKNPIPIAMVSNQSMLESASTNVIANISKTPGMSQITTGSAISKPVIRGLGFNRIITLHDGIRQEGQQWGDEHGIEIDELSVDRVEIIKGAGSLMYGSDGLGGVIHLLGPSPAAPGSVIGSWKSNYQSNNGLIGNSVMVSGNLKGVYWLLRAGHKIARSYTNANDGRVFNSGFNEQNFNTMIGINKKWGYSEFAVSSFDQTVGLVEGERDSDGKFIRQINDSGSAVEQTVSSSELDSYSLFIPKQGIQHLKLSNTSNVYFGESRIQVTMAYQRNQRKEFGNIIDKDDVDLSFDLSTLSYNLIYFFSQASDWEVSLGTSGMSQQNKNRGEEFIIPEYQSFDWGIFGFIKKPIGKLNLAGGLRYDSRTLDIDGLYLDANGSPTDDPTMELKFNNAHLKFSNLSASFGLTYEFSKSLSGKLNGSRGFRAPNISELASNGKHEGTLRYEYGSYDLKPETSFQLDASVLLNSEHLTAELSVFQNTIDHYIFTEKLLAANGMDSIPDPSDPSPAFRYTQGDAQLFGGELMIDIHPHPLDWLHFENSISFVRGVNKSKTKSDSSKYLPFIPSPRLQSELRANIKKIGPYLSNTFFKIEYTYSWEQNQVLLENGTETPTPAYALWSLGAGTGIKSTKGSTLFMLYFSVNNLFERAYQNHLSRLKYAAENQVTGRVGVFDMGRNFSFKIVVPITFRAASSS